MSAFQQSMKRFSARAGLLAGTSAAVLAIAGIGAGSAMAAPTCTPVTGGLALKGQGSTLQNVAQGEWTSKYNAACPIGSNANFSYEGTGSGAALKAFGYESGVAINKTFAYGGTDEAPASAAIAIAKAHANKVAPVIIPVAQTSIAVVANKPANCGLTGGITWANLNELFAGKIKHWSQLSTITNKTACETAEAGASITRIVRKDGSGTTYQFKNYLSELEAAPISASGPGKVLVGGVCTTETWSALRPNPTFNLLWPEAGCNTGVTTVETAEGGGGVVNAVLAKSNSIGYAAYSDVVGHSAISNALSLENANEVGVGPTYALPGQGTGSKEANCGSRTYTVPTTGRKTGGTGLEVDWSTVFGANPEIATSYPLCTLTYELSWNGFSTAGYAAHYGTAVHNYLAYELGEGQSVLPEKGYQKLPSPAANANNVLGAAELALTKVVE
jgi:ABC-type phosphate transport system substrate-binding protein